MDDLDRSILDHLRRDARTPFTEIADAAGVSESTVRNRVNQLEEDGVIQQFTVRLRGANVRALVEIEIEINTLSTGVAEQILELEGVEEVWELTGEWDLAVLVQADTTEELNRAVDGIRRIEPTRSTRTSVILDELYPNGADGGLS